MMKQKNTIALLTIFALSFSMFITGCTKISETFDENAINTTQSETSSEEGVLAKAQNQMKEFIQCVNLQDYDNITSLIYMPNDALITKDNVKWYITRTSLADITGINIKDMKIELSNGAVKKTAKVYINKVGYKFNMELDENNNWRIVLDSLYVENWSLKVPKGCSALINNINIDKYKTASTSSDNYDTYIFPAIAKQELEVKTTSSIYGEYTQNINPTTNSESYPIVCKISDAETENILRQIQSIWNGLYTDYKNGVNVLAVKKYFTNDFDNTEMTNILFTYFPKLEKNKKNSDITYSSFFMRETIPWTKDNYGSAILNTDNSILVNFGYRIDFTSSDGGAYSEKKVATITMEYDQNNSTYKIKKVNDTKLFYDNDYTLNDY